jgi:hypothetical protein
MMNNILKGKAIMEINKQDLKVIWKNPYVIIAMLAIGYWIYAYHLKHTLGILPYAIFLLCPLMHIFMHQGHKHKNGSSHSGHKSQRENESKDIQETSSILGEKNDRQ